MMQSRFKRIILLFALGVFCFSTIPAHAQQQDWNYGIVTYLWGAGLSGQVAAKGRSVEVDQSFSDILENLEFGFAGAVRAYNDRWSVNGDLMYIGLGAGTTGPLGNGIDIDVDQWLVAGDLGYQVAKNVEVLGGARVISLQNKLAFSGPAGLTVKAKKTWVDPVVGLRFAPTLSDKWSLWTRLDIGGFEVGSDFTWQLNANLVWQFSRRTALSMGYRVLDIKYDDENGSDPFVYDATSQGPIVGLVLSL